MRKPKNQNITTNAAGAATEAGRNSGVLAGDANTPAFAKLRNINLRNENTGRSGGLSALIGNARSAGGDFGNASRSAFSNLGFKSSTQQFGEDQNFSNQTNAARSASNGRGSDGRSCTVTADSDAADAWGASDFVSHYFNGGGAPINLSDVGLGERFRRAASVRQQTKEFMDTFQRPGTIITAQLSIDVTNVPGLFSLGNGAITAFAECSVTTCTYLFSYRDFFRDPLDINDSIPGDQEAAGGEPYPITYEWSVTCTRD